MRGTPPCFEQHQVLPALEQMAHLDEAGKARLATLIEGIDSRWLSHQLDHRRNGRHALR